MHVEAGTKARGLALAGSDGNASASRQQWSDVLGTCEGGEHGRIPLDGGGDNAVSLLVLEGAGSEGTRGGAVLQDSLYSDSDI